VIDLHTHTTCSDGDFSPEELIKLASKKGISTMSITDHDSVSAYDDNLFNLAKSFGLSLITGIELSTVDQETGQKIHVVGLGIDTKNKDINDICRIMDIRRRKALIEVTTRINELGFSLRLEKLLKNKNIVTKTHVAIDIISNPKNYERLKEMYGEIPNKSTIINDHLMLKKFSLSESKGKLLTHKAIDIVKKSGGKAICAHPSFNIMRGFGFDDMRNLIIRNNFDGIETINIQYDKNNNDKKFDMVDEFTEFATNRNLITSGGSDFHGNDKNIWGDHSDLGLLNESYSITKQQLEKIIL